MRRALFIVLAGMLGFGSYASAQTMFAKAFVPTVTQSATTSYTVGSDLPSNSMPVALLIYNTAADTCYVNFEGATPSASNSWAIEAYSDLSISLPLNQFSLKMKTGSATIKILWAYQRGR
jgi:hypothetical protein